MFNHPKNIVGMDPKEYGLDDFGSVDNLVTKMGAQTRLIQMINGPGQTPGDNQRPARPDEHAFFKYLRLGFKVAPTADQDNHERNWGTATPARTAVVATELTKASLLDALRRRHVYATEDKNLSVIIKVNGKLCGDVIAPLPPPSELSISFRITDPDEPTAEYAIRVFRGTVSGPDTPDAVVVNSAEVVFTSNGTGTIEDVAFSGEAQYFFFVVVQVNENGEEDRAWTAPVWFQSQPEDGSTPVVGGGTGGGSPDPSQFVASRRSNTYHVSLTCLDAQRIKQSNLVTGAAARQGREKHEGCPRTTGGR